LAVHLLLGGGQPGQAQVGPDERLAMLGVRLIALRVEARWAAALSVAADVASPWPSKAIRPDMNRRSPALVACGWWRNAVGTPASIARRFAVPLGFSASTLISILPS